MTILFLQTGGRGNLLPIPFYLQNHEERAHTHTDITQSKNDQMNLVFGIKTQNAKKSI